MNESRGYGTGPALGAISGAINVLLAALETTILAAITAATNTLAALFKWRVADANNSRTGAIAGGASWGGVATRTRGYARIDTTITNFAAGTWSVLHGDSEADVNASTPGALVGETVVDSWATAAGYTSFPTTCAIRRDWVRLYWTDGGVGGALTLAAMLDPRLVEHNIPLLSDVYLHLGWGGDATTPIPPGARSVDVLSSNQAAAHNSNSGYIFESAGGAQAGPAMRWGQATGNRVPCIVPKLCNDGATVPVQLHAHNYEGGSDTYVFVRWLP